MDGQAARSGNGRLCDRNVRAIIPGGLRFREGSERRLEFIVSKIGI
jgi:hypothetical protein